MNYINNPWKLLSIILSIFLIFILGYYFYQKDKQLNVGEVKVDTIDKNDFEYKKKQNPKYHEDNKDYFFTHITDIEFDQELYDYDTIIEGDILKRRIEFTNIGDEQFFIVEVKVSCGCTIPTYVKKPIKPNEKGFVNIEFDSKGKSGFSMNKLTLEGNIPDDMKSAYFKVYIKEK